MEFKKKCERDSAVGSLRALYNYVEMHILVHILIGAPVWFPVNIFPINSSSFCVLCYPFSLSYCC